MDDYDDMRIVLPLITLAGFAVSGISIYLYVKYYNEYDQYIPIAGYPAWDDEYI
jgi:hypothetical protein